MPITCAIGNDGPVNDGPKNNAPVTSDDQFTIGTAGLVVSISPAQGGRIAQIEADGVDLLVGRDTLPDTADPLAWGAYPMVPWAGRIRHGRFEFGDRHYELPINLGEHAIHGVGFVSPWTITRHDSAVAELSLAMPSDHRWPFGGVAGQTITVTDRTVRLELSATATTDAFPVSLGWHPWYRKPTSLDFRPTAMYRRDDEWMAVDELIGVPPSPWDDCFVNDEPITVEIGGRALRLTSDCTDWVVYDMPEHATCIEPQTAPPDAFNLRPHVLQPSETLSAWYEIELLDSAPGS